MGLHTASGLDAKAGKSSPEPDACAFGVPRAQCHNNCGYRCSRARADRERAARAAVAPTTLAAARARWSGTRTGPGWRRAAPHPLDGPYTVDVEPGGPVEYPALSTASPSVAADHANCGTDLCCGICTVNQGSTTT